MSERTSQLASLLVAVLLSVPALTVLAQDSDSQSDDVPKEEKSETEKELRSKAASPDPSSDKECSEAKKDGATSDGNKLDNDEGFGRNRGLEKLDAGRDSTVDETRNGKLTLHVEIDAIETEGSPPESEVARVLKASKSAQKWCYKTGLQLDRTLAGNVHIRLTISDEDRLNEAEVVKSTLASEEVEKCLVRVQERLAFPQADKDTEVSYRLTFSSTVSPSHRRLLRQTPN